MLYIKEFAAIDASLTEMLVTSTTGPLVLTLREYNMKPSTSVFPSNVGVQYSTTESGPSISSTVVTFVGGSGRSAKSSLQQIPRWAYTSIKKLT